MHKSLGFIAAAALLAAPAQAHDWADQTTGRHTGAFVGAQLHVGFRGKTIERPRATLGIAPTFSRMSTHAGVHTSIGEGLALSFGAKSKPELTFGGVRADRALGFTSENGRAADGKQGVSTAGWIGIGVGTLLVIGVVGVALWADHVSDCEERENGC
jgi:opacity protein-like surface antigen